MAAEVYLKPFGQAFKTSIIAGPIERSIVFGIKNAVNAEDAEVALLAAVGSTVPIVFSGLPLNDYEFDEPEHEGLFEGRVIYRTDPSGGGGIGDNRLSFNTSGGNEHITMSRNLANLYPPLSPDVTGIFTGISQPIGATVDAVEGVDIPVAVFEWEVTQTFDDDDIDDAYVETIETLTGRINSTTYKGRAAGEVLFLGASGSQVNDGPWDIAFRFASRRNKTGLTIGTITGVDVKGWQVMDVRYRRQAHGSGAYMACIMKPYLVLVHDVFEEGDFADLNLT